MCYNIIIELREKITLKEVTMKGYFIKQGRDMLIFSSFEEAKEWFLDYRSFDIYLDTSIWVADLVKVNFPFERCESEYALITVPGIDMGTLAYNDNHQTVNEKIEMRFNRVNGEYEIDVYELHNIEEYVAEISVKIKRN
jgi:hypothetical protein